MVTYLIWVNLYLAVFYGFYWMFLRRETFFQLNRIYLIGTAALALALPLVKWEAIKALWLPEPVLFFNQRLDEIAVQPLSSPVETDLWDRFFTIQGFYFLGCAIAALLFVYRLRVLHRQLQNGASGQAFSFCGWMFIDPTLTDYHSIAIHEKVHIQQWHSLDVLFFELVKIVNWFNPIAYLYTRAIKLTHEYIADDQTAPLDDRTDYANILVGQAFGAPIHSLGNHFFTHSFIKNRIIMLFKTKSKKVVYWRFAGVLPLALLLLAFQGEKTPGQDIAEAADVQRMLAPPQAPLVAKERALPNSKEQRSSTAKKQVSPIAKKQAPPVALTQDTVVAGSEVFTAVEVQPKPPGGMDAFMKYIGNNFQYPKEAVKAGVKGRLILTFVVEKDGSLSDIKIVRDLGHGMGKEAVRVLSEAAKWQPGVQNGRQVRVQYTIPIVFNVQE